MKNIFVRTKTLAIFSFLLFSLVGVPAQAQRKSVSDAELLRTIKALDAAVFDAYNRCNLEKFGSFFIEDVELYHDNGGLTDRSRQSLGEWAKKTTSVKVKREWAAGNVGVYPLRGFGAVEMGVHRFHPPGYENAEPVG